MASTTSPPATRTGPSARTAWLASMVCVAASVSSSAGWLGEDAGALVTPLVGIVATATLAWGVRRLPKGTRLGWALIDAAIFLAFVGGGLREVYQSVGVITAERSLIPDLFSGPGYLLLAAGQMHAVHMRRRGSGNAVDAVLDSILAGLAALALAWVFLLSPALASHQHTTIGVRLSIASYPPMSVLFVVITSQLAFASGKRIPALNGAVAAMVFLLIGDVGFTLVDAQVADLPHVVTLLPYLLSYCAVVYFALHPSFADATTPVRVEETTPTPARLAYVAIALAIPAMVTVTQDRTDLIDKIALALVVLALTGIATWRVVRALQHHARSERRLRFQATHDSLTGTLNRHGLLEEMSHWKGDGPVTMFFLDVDRFKLVNDTFGHSFGDDLLLRVTDRLRARHGDAAAIARIGGDEFVLVLTDVADSADAVARAEALREEFVRPFDVRGSEIPVSISVGIAITHSHPDAEALLRDADTAMYSAKEAGRDAVVLFDDSMPHRVAQRLELERDLRHALDRGELTVYYQPVVRLPGGQVGGFEALIRWHHPTRGTISPLSFIPIAEETGLISQIGAWVLDEACRQLRAWRGILPGGDQLTMAVNISARQLRDSDLPFMLDRTLWRHRLDGSALCLELTESMLLDNPDAAAAMLARLRERGIHLAIDDFGTGYSSLAYLRRFPFDRVKIDRAFVEPLDQPGESEDQLVAAILAMAEALGMTTVAEGVETIEQAERLVAMGCETAQGFYYSRPIPADAVPAALQRLGVATVDDHGGLVDA